MNKSNTTLSIILLTIVQLCSTYNKLPSYFPRCYRDDPKINECLLKATSTVKSYLTKGVPELKLPPLEPLKINEVTLKQGTSALNFEAHLKNILATGLTNYEFSRFDFDVPNMQFFCAFKLGQIVLRGDYTVKGRILVAPISGSGTFVASISSSNATMYQKVKVIQKDGLDFLFPVYTNSSISVGDPKARFKGLFENAALDDIINQVIERNANELFLNLRPVIEKTVVDITNDVVVQSIEGVPFDQLYPKKM